MLSVLKKILTGLIYRQHFIFKQKSLGGANLVVLIVLLVVLLTACGDNLLTFTEQEEAQGKLLVWHDFEGEYSHVITNVLKGFKQVNPEVQIISEYVPRSQMSSRFMAETKHGLGPNIMINLARDIDIAELVKQRRIEEISEQDLDLSIYQLSTLPQITYQGKIYIWPLGYHTSVLCYNQAKLKQSDPTADKNLSQPPTSLEGLIERAQKGYSVGIVSTFEGTFWGMGIFGVKFSDAQGKIKLELDGWAEWLQWLKKANTQPNFMLLRDRDILHNAFAQGKLTYYVCDSYEIYSLKERLKDNLRVAPLPTEPNHPATPLLEIRGMVFNPSSSPKQKKLALQLAKFMTNSEQQIKAFISSQSFIPINKQVKINQKLFPIEPVLLNQGKKAMIIDLDNLEHFLTILQQGDVIYQRAITGDITPSQAVQELTKVINEIIKDNSKT
jgi:ABC-type glycerol-3-phosphate transport system substrate-binding protein